MLSIKLNSHCGNLTPQFSLVALESFGIFLYNDLYFLTLRMFLLQQIKKKKKKLNHSTDTTTCTVCLRDIKHRTKSKFRFTLTVLTNLHDRFPPY